MTRRVQLPGTAELFRITSTRSHPGDATGGRPASAAAPATPPSQVTSLPSARSRSRRTADRQRHDEKITVYLSSEQLVSLERARLDLRAELGLVADRGRLVREAIAIVLDDLEAHGDASVIVRRLTGGR